MCRQRNIAMRDYQESVTTGQTDRETDRQTGEQTDRCRKVKDKAHQSAKLTQIKS